MIAPNDGRSIFSQASLNQSILIGGKACVIGDPIKHSHSDHIELCMAFRIITKPAFVPHIVHASRLSRLSIRERNSLRIFTVHNRLPESK